MEYRHLPHGNGQENFSVLGLGMGGIQQAGDAEIEQVVRTAIDHGINFLTCAPARAMSMRRLGAPSPASAKGSFSAALWRGLQCGGEYGWSRNLAEIRRMFAWELKTLGTEYADFGFCTAWMRTPILTTSSTMACLILSRNRKQPAACAISVFLPTRRRWQTESLIPALWI